MRVSEFYNLGKSQPSLGFLDVDIQKDIRLFLNPRALRTHDSDWGEHCAYLLQNFFETLIHAIQAGENERALDILTHLKEPNETHLGLSKRKSDGRGLGPQKAKQLWNSFRLSKAVQTGLLSDLEDTVLLIDGISIDILSDVVTNIIRGPLISYTNDICEEYNIPVVEGVDSGPVWNPETRSWDQDYVNLPLPEGEKLILMPKSIVRVTMDYDVDKYYRHYILEWMQQEEIRKNSSLVHILKSKKRKGEKKVYKKELEAKYGAEAKAVSIDKTQENPALLAQYKADNALPTPALSHSDLADIQGGASPDWDGLLKKVLKIEPGKNGAYEYEDAIADLLYALFHPVLVDPKKQVKIHNDLKRVDITFTNYAQEGFFYWLSRHYPCPHIFIECKNYGKDLGNPEVDQMAMRFSQDRGKFGIIVCRSIDDRGKLLARCKAVTSDDHKYIVVLDDQDLIEIVESVKNEVIQSYSFPRIKKLFDQLLFQS